MKRVLVVTGTRADFGKQRGLMRALEAAEDFQLQVVVTGMHLIERYGETVLEVLDEGFSEVHQLPNQIPGEPMDLVLANTIAGFGRLVHDRPPDAIIVHGDRLEALAGAIVGAVRNIRVIHLEGGELSGTIDGSLRHAITKLAHVHLVANEVAGQRLIAMGETPDSVLRVGSLEVDALLDAQAPEYGSIAAHYGLPEGPLGVAILHPVTTDPARSRASAEALVEALLTVDLPFVVIDPNNDEGTLDILHAYERLSGHMRIRRLPSMRFEAFVTLLKHCVVVVGNSSSGVREAPVFGTRSVNIGTRQRGRADAPTIRHVGPDASEIVQAIEQAVRDGRGPSTTAFGAGGSLPVVMEALRSEALWALPLDKRFFENG